jgi:hypothetical protein
VFGFLMPHRAETPKTRSQQHLARRATPVFLSIQLTHVSSAVSETGLGTVTPQFRGLAGPICSGSLVQSTTGVTKPTGVLTIASRRSAMTELLRRETGEL